MRAICRCASPVLGEGTPPFCGVAGGDEGSVTINFDEFLTALALIGNVKYADVGAMDVAAKVEALVANFLNEGDAQAVAGKEQNAVIAGEPDNPDEELLQEASAASANNVFERCWQKLSCQLLGKLWSKDLVLTQLGLD